MEIEPIAFIKTDFKEKFGLPRQSGQAELTGTIIFEEKYKNDEALRGLEQFSHIWLLFDFSASHKDGWHPTVRPPRLGGNKRMGVFATRSPYRPNHIGLSCVRLEKIEKTAHHGTVLTVSGVDMLDNTPIYDIKPYLPYADCRPEALSGFAPDSGSKLEVKFEEGAEEKLPEGKKDVIAALLANDPRPRYHNDSERVYTMEFAGQEISFRVCGRTVTVLK